MVNKTHLRSDPPLKIMTTSLLVIQVYLEVQVLWKSNYNKVECYVPYLCEAMIWSSLCRVFVFQQCKKPRTRPFDRCQRCHVLGHLANVSLSCLFHLHCSYFICYSKTRLKLCTSVHDIDLFHSFWLTACMSHVSTSLLHSCSSVLSFPAILCMVLFIGNWKSQFNSPTSVLALGSSSRLLVVSETSCKDWVLS